MRLVLVVLVLGAVLGVLARPILVALVRLTGTSVVSAEPVPETRSGESSSGPDRKTP